MEGGGLWCLMPLSTTFQLYHGSLFKWSCEVVQHNYIPILILVFQTTGPVGTKCSLNGFIQTLCVWYWSTFSTGHHIVGLGENHDLTEIWTCMSGTDIKKLDFKFLQHSFDLTPDFLSVIKTKYLSCSIFTLHESVVE